MNRRFSYHSINPAQRRLIFIVLSFQALTALADEQPRSEKYQIVTPVPAIAQKAAKETLEEKKKPRRKIWEISAKAGAYGDNNINHLLKNLNINSNTRRPDTIFQSEIGFELTPDLSKDWKTDIFYAYTNYDYRHTPSFSYHNHLISVSLLPAITSSLALDLGGYADWAGDQGGVFYSNTGAVTGIAWNGPKKLRVRAGYEYSHDNVPVNRARDADAPILYVRIIKSFLNKHAGFMTYRYRSNNAAEPDFSYKSNSVRAGILSYWPRGFRTMLSAGFTDQPYNNRDTRFLKIRRDNTYTLTFQPALTLFRGLDAVAAFTYLHNHSNVEIKSYSDQIYALSLEARY